MDPVTTSIIATVTSGLIIGVGKVAEKAVVAAYDSLKQLIWQRYRGDSELAQAIKMLEEKPTSEARQAVLQEEIVAVNAHEDPELIHAAEQILDKLKEIKGESVIQTAIGRNIAISNNYSQATVNTQEQDDD